MGGFSAVCIMPFNRQTFRTGAEEYPSRSFVSRLLKVRRDMVLHDRRLPADLKGAHRVFNVPVLDSDSLMLPLMLSPRFHNECLDPAAWIGQILKQAPIDRTIAPPDGP
jgi:hypothetical protein